ncbi:MAG: asparagine--tRNA ligase [Nanoarchaeota archaeon]|nr:asparagine--tRNA ligase [Nanoarchaeota archaeon]MCG2718723.1 asparagine--tRNA ligase [Nanoarchaeota archaeon]
MKDKFISIKEAMNKGKGKVSIRGWVYRERKSNKFIFFVVRDSTNIIQCVIKNENVSKEIWDAADKVLIETSLKVTGTVRKDKRAPTGYELEVDDMEIVSYAEDFPMGKDQSYEFQLDMRHLGLRSRKLTAMMKIRSTVFGAIHEYFRGLGYFEFQSPSIVNSAGEGGSTLFTIDYFGKPVYLTQTWQLYAEAAIFALEKIYTIAPSFRAEKSKTSRHLTEYWHAEVEATWLDFEGLQDLGEGLLKHIVKSVLEKHKEDLEILERDVSKLEPTVKKKFPRMTYDDVLKLLKEKKGMDIKWGKDLRTIEEDKLSELFDTPVIVTRYPKEVKAFYMKEDPENKKVVLGYDAIGPEGYGELIGASEREVDIEELKRKLKAEGEDPEKYKFYLDTRRYGSVPHSGFGMGVERVISWICGLDNIKDAIPFPRTMTRTNP